MDEAPPPAPGRGSDRWQARVKKRTGVLWVRLLVGGVLVCFGLTLVGFVVILLTRG